MIVSYHYFEILNVNVMLIKQDISLSSPLCNRATPVSCGGQFISDLLLISRLCITSHQTHSSLPTKEYREVKTSCCRSTMFSTSPVKGTFQKQLSGFFSVKGVPRPPTPLTENHFSKKPLAELGGTPSPPPLTESPLSFSGIFFAKRTKNDVFGTNKVKKGPKRPYDRPKRAKNV